MYKKLFIFLLIVLVVFSSIAAVKEYKRLPNLRIKGWLFGDSSWCGMETWANAAQYDTVAISGIDTTCYFFAFPVDASTKGPLYGYISRNGDSVFVRCDSTLATTNKYVWMVIRP